MRVVSQPLGSASAQCPGQKLKKIGIAFAPKSKNVGLKLKENLKEFGL